MDRSSAYFLVSSARRWLAGRIGYRLTSSFLPLISGLPGSPDGALIGLVPRSFRSSVACPARRMNRSSAYFLIPSAHQWLAGRIAHWLTSSYLPLINGLPDGSPDGSLIGSLPRSLRSSVAYPARRTDRSSATWAASVELCSSPYIMTSMKPKCAKVLVWYQKSLANLVIVCDFGG